MLRSRIPVTAWSAVVALALAVPACQSTSSGFGFSAGHETYDAATFFATTSISGASFSSAEDEILFTSDATGVYNAYKISVEGGEPVQLSCSEDRPIRTLSFFPDDGRFLYMADEGGNELDHVYVQELDGSVVDLTPGEKLKARFFGWSADDTAFFVLTNERDEEFFDLYRYDVAVGYPRELVFQNPGGLEISDVSLDGRWVALTKVRNNADNDVFVWDARDPKAEPRHLTPHEGDVSHGVQSFTPDGTHLYYSSDEGGEYHRVFAYDLEAGERELVEADDDWDVSYVGFSRKGRYKVVGVNADARTRVTVTDLERGRTVRFSGLPRGDVRGITFSRSEERMAFYVNGDTAPSNLFVMELGTGRVRKLTDSMNPEIDPDHLVESRVVRYESFDGLKIPALLYRPRTASSSEPAPGIVLVHGGPGGQSRTGYNPMVQHLVNHGYTVLAVNNRGSSGYGKTFFHMDDRRHGDVDLKDCVFGRRYLETLDWVDGDRVAIMGGSYGGYMVCAALAFEPEAFDVGIDIFGVTNWPRTLANIPPWWADFREYLYAEMGDPQEDAERLARYSPLLHAENITKPLLVVQGANDPRVLQKESDEMVAAVRANGVPVEYVLFEDEGHGFRNRANRIEASEAYLAFLERTLRGVPTP